MPAVVSPPPSFRDGSSRPTAGARRTGCAVREGREPWARIACRTRAGIARATWRGSRSVAGRCRAARPKGRLAGCPGCRPAGRAAPGWWESARPDHARVCPRVAPRRGAGDVAGRPGGRSATMPRERHHEWRALTGRDRTMWARGHHAGTVGPGESVTGPSRRCRRDGSLWGVTEAPATLGIFTTG